MRRHCQLASALESSAEPSKPAFAPCSLAAGTSSSTRRRQLIWTPRYVPSAADAGGPEHTR